MANNSVGAAIAGLFGLLIFGYIAEPVSTQFSSLNISSDFGTAKTFVETDAPELVLIVGGLVIVVGMLTKSGLVDLGSIGRGGGM